MDVEASASRLTDDNPDEVGIFLNKFNDLTALFNKNYNASWMLYKPVMPVIMI